MVCMKDAKASNEACVYRDSETFTKGYRIGTWFGPFVYFRPSPVSSTSSCILSIGRSLDREFEDSRIDPSQFIRFRVAKGGNERSLGMIQRNLPLRIVVVFFYERKIGPRKERITTKKKFQTNDSSILRGWNHAPTLSLRYLWPCKLALSVSISLCTSVAPCDGGGFYKRGRRRRRCWRRSDAR